MSDEALERYKAQRLIQRMKTRAATPDQQPAPAEEDCVECEENPVTAASPDDVIIHGTAMPYDIPTGDGRQVRGGAVTWDLENEPVPIIWDRDDGDHSGMVLGRVDSFINSDGELFVEQARLFATEDPVAQAAVNRVVELIGEGAIGWSMMLDDEEVEVTHKEPEYVEHPDGTVTVRFKRSDDMSEIISARARHLALVDTPAFPGARPILGPAPVNAAASMVATYNARHFDRWESNEKVPLQVTPDGRVWGHAAGDTCYRTGSKAGTCQKYRPDPDKAMKNFHTGTVTLDNGAVIRAGSLTCANLHASPNMTHSQQRQHHENSSTVWARVVAWNDSKGRLCVSGSVVPGMETTASAVAGLPISVELWPVPGVSGLTLVGAHTVVTPAWPV